MATELTCETVCRLLPERPRDAHKGTFGHVFLLAGSRGFTGAAKLAAEGALRAGAGLATVGVPRPLADIIATALTEAMSLPLPSTEAESLASEALRPALEFASSKQAVVLGPGLSQQPETTTFVREFVRQCPIPLLVDADGLNCLSGGTAALAEAEAPCIVTPHPGEMARLTGLSTREVQDDREGAARRFAADHGCVVVLKGHGTVIAGESGECYVNATGNSGMATGGTGDVLAGLLGGLMAQGMACIDAAQLGVFAHGLAGDIAAASMTERGVIARDLLGCVPKAWHRIERGA